MSKRLRISKKGVSVIVFLFVGILSFGFAVDATNQNPAKSKSSQVVYSSSGYISSPTINSTYVAGEVLIGLKDGADPEAVLRAEGLTSGKVDRVHSIAPAAKKFIKTYKLEKDSDGWYSFLGKNYKEVSEIPDEEAFKEAYTVMPETEKQLYRSYKVNLPKDVSVEQAIAQLKQNPDVEYAEPNRILTATMVPNDPYYFTAGSWGQPYDDLWGIKRIQCEQAWDSSQGEGIIVAVVDSGVDFNHEDIAENMWRNPNEIPDNNVDDDGNGKIDDIFGWDFIGESFRNATEDNDPKDAHGHGTHCAGTIAAIGNNSKGVIGVAPRAKIMSVRGLDNYGYGTTASLAAGIKYAADMGARVISNSWGSDMPNPVDPVAEAAVAYAHQKGSVVVFAAGNNADDVANYSPANNAKVIAVASTDRYDARSSFSNYGSLISVAAPGSDILSLCAQYTSQGLPLLPDFKYTSLYGTSMACPHVAGLAANLLSRNPKLTPDEVKNYIKSNTDSLSPDHPVGTGRINAARAVAAVPQGTSLRVTGVQFTDPQRISITARHQGSPVVNPYLKIAKCGTENWVPVPISGQIPNGGAEFVLTDYEMSFQETFYKLKLECDDYSGGHYTDTFVFSVNNVFLTGLSKQFASSGVVQILGTIKVPGFICTVEYGKGKNPTQWSSNGVTVYTSGPCTNTAIAGIDVSSLPEDGNYTFRLRGSYNGFNTSDTLFFFHAKDARPGWPQSFYADTSNLGGFVTDLDGSQQGKIVVLDNNKRLSVWDKDGALLDQYVLGSDAHMISQSPLVFTDLDSLPGNEIIYSYYGLSDAEHVKIGVATYGKNGARLTPMSGWPQTLRSQNFLINGSNITVDTLSPGGGKNIVIAGLDWKSPDVFTGRLFIFNANGNLINTGSRDLFTIHTKDSLLDLKLVCADLNEDGQKEIIVAFSYLNSSDMVSYVLIDAFRPDGTPYRTGNWPVRLGTSQLGFAAIGGIATGDINHDGHVEIVFTNEDRKLGILDRQGNFLYGSPKQYTDLWLGVIGLHLTIPVTLCDLDNDGYLEIVTVQRQKLYVLNYDGTDRVGWPLDLKEYFGVGRTVASCDISDARIADISGDGKPDILCGGVATFGDGHEVEKFVIAFDAEKNPIRQWQCLGEVFYWSGHDRGPSVCDIDHDGKLDIVSMDSSESRKNTSFLNVWGTQVPYVENALQWTQERNDLERASAYRALIPPSTRPNVFAVNPQRAMAGTAVNISGTRFGQSAAGLRVVFANETDAAILAVTDTSISCTVPMNAVSGDLYVVTDGGTSNRISCVIEPKPAAPSALQAALTGDKKIKITWLDNSTNEEAFKLERATDASGPFTEIANLGPGIKEYLDTNVSYVTTYYYRVYAIVANGRSDYSEISNGVCVEYPIPAAPTNLRLSQSSYHSITINWMDNSTNEQGFKVERRTAQGTDPYIEIATLVPETYAYTDSNLTANTGYLYRVRAFNQYGNSAYTNELSASTLNDGTPAAPTNLQASLLPSGARVQLAWQDNANNEQQFIVERSLTQDAGFQTKATLGAETTQYTDNSPAYDTTYFYRVYATNPGGSSGYSNTVQIRTPVSAPMAPSEPACVDKGMDYVTLNWKDNSQSETGFKIYRDNVLVGTVTQNVTAFTDTGLTKSTTYSYNISAYNAGGESFMWRPLSVTTFSAPFNAPSNLQAVALSYDQVRLTWQDNSAGEENFFVERSTTGASSDYQTVGNVAAGSTSFTNTYCQGQTTYYYRVRAYAQGVLSGYSNVAQATTPIAPPNAPSNLSVKSKGEDFITLLWTDNSQNESGFKVKRNGVVVATLGPNIIEYTDTNLTSSTWYSYSVFAYNTAGDSFSVSKSVQTTAPAPPTKPTDLAAAVVTKNRVQIQWLDNSTKETGYKINRKLDGDPSYTEIASLPANAVSYTDTADVRPETTYVYGVSAYNAIGSTSSDPLTVTTPADNPPVFPSIGNLTTNENQLLQLTLNASDPDNDPLTFEAVHLPKGASFNPNTRVFSWIPAYTQAGTYPVTFTVSDGHAVAFQDVTITVKDVNRPPVFVPISNKTVYMNQLLTFTVNATDPDNDALTYSTLGLPPGAKFNVATRTFSWIPSGILAGTYRAIFAVRDAKGASASKLVLITVRTLQPTPVPSPTEYPTPFSSKTSYVPTPGPTPVLYPAAAFAPTPSSDKD